MKLDQSFKISYTDQLELAIIYYGIVTLINGIHLTKRQTQLMAFTAIKGTISAGGAREEFCKKFKTTKPTVNNMISALKNRGLLIKQGNKISVHPRLSLDFTTPITLLLKLSPYAAD